MPSQDPAAPLSRFQIRFVRGCAFFIVTIGLMVLLGWALEIPLLTALAPGKRPMAVSTALLFVIYGVTLFLRTLPGTVQKRVRHFQMIVHCMGPFIAWALAGLSYRGVQLSGEPVRVVMEQRVPGFFSGISVVTAFCFTLSSLSFWMSLLASDAKRYRSRIARWLSAILIAISFVLILAYLIGMPLFYGTTVIPPALPTGVAFLIMGVALFILVWPRSSKNGLPRRSTGILLMVFVFFVTGILTAGSLMYRASVKRYRGQMEQQLSSVAELKVAELEQWRLERFADADIVHGNITFAKLVRRYFNSSQDRDARQQLTAWLRAFPEHYGYDQVRLLDTKGKTRISIPERTAPISKIVRDHVSDAVRFKQNTMVDLYRNEFDGQIYLALLVPIIDPAVKDRVIALVSIRVDPKKYLYPYILRWPTPSRTAETLLVRREGSDVLFLNDLKFKKGTVLDYRIPLHRSRVAAVMAVLGRRGIVEGVDYRGVPSLADIRPVPGSPWFLVTRMDISEAYAPVQFQSWTLVGLVIVLVFASVAILAFVWRKQSLEFYQKQAEAAEAIRKNSELYQAILRTTPDGFWLTDAQGKIIDVNSTYSRMSGYSRDELMNMQMSDLEASESTEEVAAHRAQITKIGKDVFESRHRRKDGSVWPVEVSSSYWPGANGHFIVFFRDIARRKRAEDALRESELIFSKFMEYSPIYVFFKDKQIRSLRLSKNFEFLIGRPVEQLLGKSMDELFPSEFAKKMVEDDLRVFREGKNIDIEEHFGGRSYHTIKFPIIVNGVMEYIAGFNIDITEQKRVEEELVAARKEAENALKNRAKFLDIAVHELRTPVTSFSLLLQLAQKQMKEGRPLTEAFLERLRDPVDRLTRLVVDLLDVSRLERGQLVVRPIRSELVSLMMKSVEEFRVQVPKREIQFSQPEQAIDIDLDPVRIHQVISNLLDNAVKYTPEDRSIEVKIEFFPSTVRVSVIDHGDGIPKEQLDNLFTPFSRGSSEATVRASGLGLGLAVCRGIIELHGGTIGALSEVGRGSTFYFELPRIKSTG